MKYHTRERIHRILENAWFEIGRTVTLTVSGDSMEPLLRSKEQVRVRFGLTEPLRFGDIILFRRFNARIIHRFIIRVGPFCLEKGDANRFPSVCLYKEILGILVQND